jgi:hypothetical protein
MDCSLALYNLLQTHTVCGDSNNNNNPFCTEYHASSPHRSSLYYFLPHTMQEFPFAWWHKCILLQGRVLSTREEMIHCSQWAEQSISIEDMLSVEGLYQQGSVLETLLRINGSITSQVVQAAVQNLTATLKQTFTSFSTSGYASEVDLELARTQRQLILQEVAKLNINNNAVSDLSSSSQALADQETMLRIGAPGNFNMKCYSQTSIPADFVTRITQDGRDCAVEMLIWVNNEFADFLRYDKDNSMLDLGRSGISKDCFEFAEAHLKSYGGSGRLKGVFSFIQDSFLAGGDTGIPLSNSLLVRGLELNNFLDAAYNHASQGLLIAEYVPQAMEGVTEPAEVHKVEGSVTHKSRSSKPRTTEWLGSQQQQQNNNVADPILGSAPCVKMSDFEGTNRLPPCLPDRDDPIPLSKEHCEAAYEQVTTCLPN